MIDNNEKKKWQVIIRWVGTILSLALLVYLFFTTGIEEIVSALNKLSFESIALIIVLIFVSRIATFLRWHMLLQIETIKVPWKDSLRLTFAGLFAANFLPTTIGGDVVRLAGAMRIGISGTLAAASLMTDRLVGMAGMGLALPFGLPALLGYFDKPAFEQGAHWLGIWAIGKSILQKLGSAVKKIFENFSFWLKHPKYLLLALLFTFVHMAAIFLIIHIIIVDLGENMSFWQIAGIWSLTYFITLIPISINGLGLQEVTITNLFSLLGGLSVSASITIAIVIRALWIIGSLPGALFLSSILSGAKRSNYAQQIEDSKK